MKSYQQLIVIIIFISAWEHVKSAPQIKLTPYSANQTACYINGILYEKGDAIPADHPCEICRCRPPGFSCSYKHCPPKPAGCRTIEIDGQCCPDYDCGCTYDGRVYYDGQRIPHSPNPCVTCYCKRNIVRCALNECRFRYDCEPEYVPGQCCPRYDHCNRSNQKNKFRSSSIQENMETGTLVKPFVESKGGSQNDDGIERGEIASGNGDQETTEVVTVMRNDHRSKSSLISEQSNRVNLRRKKVYIGPNNKLLIDPNWLLQPTISSISNINQQSPTTTEPSLISGMVSISSGLIKNSEQSGASTTESIPIKDFVDDYEVTSETRKPPYELDFDDLHQSTTSSPQSDLFNQDPLVEIVTTENSEPTLTTTIRSSFNHLTRSPKSLSPFATTVVDEIETESIPVDLSSSREEVETIFKVWKTIIENN